MHFRPGLRWISPPRIVALTLLFLTGALHPALSRGQAPPLPPKNPTPADTMSITADTGTTEEPGPSDGLEGKGSLGLSLGAMKYLTGNELSSGSLRPILRASFKYVWNRHLVSVVESGWGWNAYGEGGSFDGPDSVGTLATVVPITIGVDYRFYTSNLRFVPRVGGGLGAYIIGVRAGRDQISRDPVTDQKREGGSFGLYGKAGFEYLMKPTFALNVDVLYHQVFSADAENFPRGWLDDNTSILEMRVGLAHYFTIHNPATAEGAEEETSE